VSVYYYITMDVASYYYMCPHTCAGTSRTLQLSDL
jgi:hypothetical protein